MISGLWRPPDKRVRRPDGGTAPHKDRGIGSSNGDGASSPSAAAAQPRRMTPSRQGRSHQRRDGHVKPASKTRGGAAFPTSKILKSNSGFTSSEDKWKSTKKVKLRAAEETVIIGFDGEWTKASEIPLPSKFPHNKILSYQWGCRLGEWAWSGIGYTRAGFRLRFPQASETEVYRMPERVEFGGLLAYAIEDGIKRGQLTRWPRQVVAVAHWTRADLSAMADYSVIKRRFDGVQKTYVTIWPMFWVRANVGGHLRVFGVRLADTMLLVPGSQRGLAALGDLYGFPKLDVGSYIDRMDLLLADNPELYEQYAIRDAEISARHLQEVWRFANDELDLGLHDPPITLGSLAATNLVKTWERQGVCGDQVLDVRKAENKKFNSTRNRYFTVKGRKHSEVYELHEVLAVKCFHGGRNECFAYGPTINTREEGTPPFREYDLMGAYAVALASIGMPDWEAMRRCHDPGGFMPGMLGMARVAFEFPRGTRFPSLPVVAPKGYGLIYPLEGEAYATASEIAVARRMGVEVEISDGIIVPWCPDDPRRPFAMVISELQRRRNEYPKNSLPNELLKQLINSIYGKLGQGLKGVQAFDPRTDAHTTIDECRITNAFLAGYVSGQVRALISELIDAISADRLVISVTTDALITNASLGEINIGGPIARFMANVKQELTGDPTLLELKYEAHQLLPWRTRGIATLKRPDGAKPKLARGGMREPAGMSPAEANDWFCRSMLLRQPGDKWASDDPLPFPFAHLSNADHVFQEVSRKVNFEWDMKRAPVEPVIPRYVRVPGEPEDILIAQHIAFVTRPWRSLADFTKNRELFDQWLRRG